MARNPTAQGSPSPVPYPGLAPVGSQPHHACTRLRTATKPCPDMYPYGMLNVLIDSSRGRLALERGDNVAVVTRYRSKP